MSGYKYPYDSEVGPEHVFLFPLYDNLFNIMLCLYFMDGDMLSR